MGVENVNRKIYRGDGRQRKSEKSPSRLTRKNTKDFWVGCLRADRLVQRLKTLLERRKNKNKNTEALGQRDGEESNQKSGISMKESNLDRKKHSITECPSHDGGLESLPGVEKVYTSQEGSAIDS